MDEGAVATSPAGRGAVADVEDDARVALQRGDRARALTLLMSAYGQAVFRYCRAILRDPAMAEDVHQTVFFQAYQDFHRFGGRSSLALVNGASGNQGQLFRACLLH